MLPEMWTCEAAIVALIVGSGFFSAAEAALFSLSSMRLNQLEAGSGRAGELIKRLLEVPRRLIITLILGAETANLLAAILIAWVVTEHWSAGSRRFYILSRLDLTGSGPLIVSLITAFVLIVLGAQVLPKTLGVLYNAALARAFAYPLWIFTIAMFPFRRVLRVAADLVLRGLGAAPESAPPPGLAGEDLKELVEAGSREGLLDRTERELLVNLLRSGEIMAGEIMTPFHEIASLAADATEEAARKLMEEHDYSRLPVFEGNRRHIAGVITAKDLLKLRLWEHEGKAAKLRDVMRPPLFVPESRRLRDLLLDFKRSRLHMALVADEYGAISGLVTMEDVLEEIFGEVQKEADEEELTALGENRWRAPGRMELSEFNTRINATIPSGGTRTLAGLVLSRLGRRPRPGDEIALAGFVFHVLEVQGIIIRRLEARREGRP